MISLKKGRISIEELYDSRVDGDLIRLVDEYNRLYQTYKWHRKYFGWKEQLVQGIIGLGCAMMLSSFTVIPILASLGFLTGKMPVAFGVGLGLGGFVVTLFAGVVYDAIKGPYYGIEEKLKNLRHTALKVDQALAAGYDPFVPPDWAHNRVEYYTGAIPLQVEKAIDKAAPIFGRENIFVYDPDPSMFAAEKHDPIVVGRIASFYFWTGSWNLARDIAYLGLK